MTILIRDAREDDLPQILAIHNHVIATTTANYNHRPAELDRWRSLLRERQAGGIPFLVAAEGELIAGYASFGPFRPQDGFFRTVEHMIYVAETHHRRGIANALMTPLIGRARALGLHVMVGGLDATNAPSIAFHERLGFEKVGLMPQVGYKFGRYLDLLWMQKTLD